MSKIGTVDVIYSGSVKDVLRSSNDHEVTFKFTDYFSVFDWGRMPDAIEYKGTALSQLAAHFFTELRDAKAWSRFSATETARKLRQSNPFGADFVETGEELQKTGLHTHYLRLVNDHSIQVQKVNFEFPEGSRAFGVSLYDYRETLAVKLPKLIPLEVIFRFGITAESSILKRTQKDPDYLSSIGAQAIDKVAGARMDFPIIELFTKLEPTDRVLSFSEALAISGLSIAQFDLLLSQTAWIAAFLKDKAHRGGLDLID